MGIKPIFWGALAIVYFAAAVRSIQHYRDFRKAVIHVRFKDVKITKQYEREFDELLAKSEMGLQTRLIRGMIPLEIVGFIAAGIALLLEFL